MEGINLFDPNLLQPIVLSLRSEFQTNGLIIRPLNTKDYDKGFLQLLSHLTEVGNITKEQFLSRFYSMKNCKTYFIVVIEDASLGKVIGSASLVIEEKFIHSCGINGRLEDVVVNKGYRGRQLGKLIVVIIKNLSQSLQCYKLTLECKDQLIPFYQSVGFVTEVGNANSMKIRFPHKNPVEYSRL